MFININKKLWPIAALYALIITRAFFFTHNFELTDFSNLIAGTLSNHLCDVSKRISFFYTNIAVLISSFSLLWVILSQIITNKNSRSLPFINATSLIGIAIILLEVSSIKHEESLWFIIFIQLSFLIQRFVFEPKISVNHLIFLHGLSYVLSFIARDFSLQIVDINKLPPFLVFYSIAFVIICFILKLVLNKIAFERIVYITKPLFVIPFLFFISTEIFLILNQHKIYFVSPTIIYIVSLSAITTFSILRYRRSISINQSSRFISITMPILILTSMVITTYYTPIINQSTEIFELANFANATMRTFSFGEIPFINYISSHMFSDMLYRFIYTTLNGFSNMPSLLIYDFMFTVSSVVYSFIILYYIFKDWKLPLMFLMFIPLTDYILYSTSTIIIINILSILNFNKTHSKKALWASLLIPILLVFYKLDVGIANFFSCYALLIVVLLKNNLKTLWIRFIKYQSLVIIGFLVLILIVELLSREHIFIHIKEAIDYFGAAQAHGFVDVSYSINQSFYNIYFIFPTIIVAILMFTLFKIIKIPQLQNGTTLIVLFYLSVYYIMNFQRGLVRHSLMESDNTTKSVFFTIILGLIFYFMRKKTYAKQVIIFSAIIMYSNLKVGGAIGEENLFNKFEDKFRHVQVLTKEDHKIARCVENKDFADKTYTDFVSFMDSNFDKNATFIDFSNTPMLYFYAERYVPSYFNQSIQNVITEFQQKEMIKRFKNYDIPVVIFSNLPEKWWDATDGIPNTIRYNILGQYIYKNYIPYKQISNKYIWVNKSINTEKLIGGSLATLSVPEYKMEWYAYALAQNRISNQYDFNKINATINSNKITFSEIDNRINNYLEIRINNTTDLPQNVKLSYGENEDSGSFEFITKQKSSNNYLIPLSSQYNWVKSDISDITITLPKDVFPESAQLNIENLNNE